MYLFWLASYQLVTPFCGADMMTLVPALPSQLVKFYTSFCKRTTDVHLDIACLSSAGRCPWLGALLWFLLKRYKKLMHAQSKVGKLRWTKSHTFCINQSFPWCQIWGGQLLFHFGHIFGMKYIEPWLTQKICLWVVEYLTYRLRNIQKTSAVTAHHKEKAFCCLHRKINKKVSLIWQWNFPRPVRLTYRWYQTVEHSAIAIRFASAA